MKQFFLAPMNCNKGRLFARMSAFLWMVVFAATSANAQTLYPGNDIQAAINQAAPGATITLTPGEYRIYSTLQLKAGVTLKGANKVLKAGFVDIIPRQESLQTHHLPGLQEHTRENLAVIKCHGYFDAINITQDAAQGQPTGIKSLLIESADDSSPDHPRERGIQIDRSGYVVIDDVIVKDFAYAGIELEARSVNNPQLKKVHHVTLTNFLVKDSGFQKSYSYGGVQLRGNAEEIRIEYGIISHWNKGYALKCFSGDSPSDMMRNLEIVNVRAEGNGESTWSYDGGNNFSPNISFEFYEVNVDELSIRNCKVNTHMSFVGWHGENVAPSAYYNVEVIDNMLYPIKGYAMELAMDNVYLQYNTFKISDPAAYGVINEYVTRTQKPMRNLYFDSNTFDMGSHPMSVFNPTRSLENVTFSNNTFTGGSQTSALFGAGLLTNHFTNIQVNTPLGFPLFNDFTKYQSAIARVNITYPYEHNPNTPSPDFTAFRQIYTGPEGSTVHTSRGVFSSDPSVFSSNAGSYATSEYIDGAPWEDQALYQWERNGFQEGKFSLTIPDVEPGTYQVVLHFAEIFHDQPGQRVFNVSVDYGQILHQYDIFQQAQGKNKATTETFLFNLEGNTLNLNFDNNDGADAPKISAIEVIRMRFPDGGARMGQKLLAEVNPLSLSPNPAQETISLYYQAATAQEGIITLTDGLSREQKRIRAQFTAGSNRLSIPTTDLPNGLYVITLRAGQQRLVKKVIVAK